MAGVAVVSKNIYSFDPRSVIPGCVLWLDGSDLNTMTLSGNDILTWTNKAGYANATGSAGSTLQVNQATINGLPTVRASSACSMTIGSIPFSTTYRNTFVVMQNPSTTLSTAITILTSGNTVGIQLYSNSSGLAYSRSGSYAFVMTTQTGYLNAVSMISATVNSTEINGYINGIPQTLTNVSNPFAAGSSTLTIGGGAQIDIAEILIFEDITLSQRQQIEGYLAAKWGLQSQVLTPFSPALSVPGCKYWFDAADTSTVYSDTGLTTLASTGGLVGGWKDKSGNAYHGTQATSGNQFTYTANYINGLNVMSIPAAGFMNMPNFSYTSRFRSIFTVVKVGSSTSFYLFQNGGTTFVTPQTYSYNGTLVLTNANINILSSSNANLLNTTSIVETINSTALNSILLNGVQQTLTANNAGTTGAFNTGACTGNTIGFSGNVAFYMAEIILYDSDLSDTNRKNIESYLAKKWNLSTPNVVFPTTHPYYSLKPYTRIFQPTDIPSCILWLDAADNSTITLSGSNVTNWKDKSGYGGYTNTGSPTYSATQLNGLPAITTATATPTYITGSFGAGLASTQYYTLFFVFNYTNYSGNNSRLFGMAATGANDFSGSGFNASLSGIGGPGVSPISFLFQNCSGTITPNSYASTTGPQIVTITISGNTIIPNTFGIGTPSFGPGGNTIGADWGEALIFNTSLTTSQIQKIQGYLAWKWGSTQYNGFNPTSISGCRLWLDSADLGTLFQTTSFTTPVTTYGQTVGSIRDKSGTGADYTGNALYSFDSQFGRPGFYFSDRYLAPNTTNYNITGTSFTVIIVFNRQSQIYAVQEIARSGQNWIRFINTSGSFSVNNNSIAFTATNGVAILTANGTTFTGYINGTSQGTGTATSPTNFSYNFGGNSSSGNYGFDEPFQGYIYEILIYNNVLTTTQQANIESYLEKKWNISTGSMFLIDNHPYISFPPSSEVNTINLPVSPKVYLTAYTYSGTGTWYDRSGNGFNATIENGVIAKNTAGNGIVLNGSTNWTFSNIAAGNIWSISVWYKNTGATTGAGYGCVLTQIFNGTPINIALGYTATNTIFQGSFFDGGAWRTGSAITLTNNIWQHFGVTWDGTTMTTYVNGALLGSTTPGSTSSDGGLAYRIGRRWDLTGNPDYMVGEIGEVCIYTSTLTASQILYQYNQSRYIYKY